ncbi:KdsC family phosphatase [Crateriforma conspicua]|uniref:3-deoxy-D-manno-octulosonate 8-phosphate phosphatase KdsC n=1 Tax=Crateriforma conspicua TaxID=2527996 RepID=A0A5C5YEY0_9PLAN|nr:HAD hydrolase family protein [Crateriforma conspicua]QDV61929.1 3-deoxy-D-manno-octulosonate 8-phosphate phosphatase KdsC [Crateriforma conspicua]TWT71822.1 3-deoxy-D-manno-octulosonate 8-phosphate phosphatase KdsC [Crateriforma conspicua]
MSDANGFQPSPNDIADQIRCLISDVDGVMTDGRITYDDQLVESKSFHARDGLAIKLWMRSGFGFGILTARKSKIVPHRAGELGIDQCVQGFEDKWPAAEQIMRHIGCTPEQTCYIGDDLPDIAVMRRVGLSVAPADASADARDIADWVLRTGGGQGALRELVECLLKAKGRWEEHVPT